MDALAETKVQKPPLPKPNLSDQAALKTWVNTVVEKPFVGYEDSGKPFEEQVNMARKQVFDWLKYAHSKGTPEEKLLEDARYVVCILNDSFADHY